MFGVSWEEKDDQKEKNSAQSAAVIFGSTETTTPKTNAEAILEAAEKSFLLSFILLSACRYPGKQTAQS